MAISLTQCIFRQAISTGLVASCVICKSRPRRTGERVCGRTCRDQERQACQVQGSYSGVPVIRSEPRARPLASLHAPTTAPLPLQPLPGPRAPATTPLPPQPLPSPQHSLAAPTRSSSADGRRDVALFTEAYSMTLT